MSGTAQITVKYVNPVKPGKTNGSIKDINGEMYGCPPNFLTQFQPDRTYDIAFSSRNYQGQTYHTITSATPVGQVGGQAPAGNSQGRARNVDDATAERIFVCGALNAAIQGGHVEIADVTLSNVVNILRSVWANTMAKPPKANDMNDDIPF